MGKTVSSMISTKSTQRGLNTYLNTFQPENGNFLNTMSLSPKKGCVYKKKSGNWGLDEIDCHRSHKGQYTSNNTFLHSYENFWKKISEKNFLKKKKKKKKKKK